MPTDGIVVSEGTFIDTHNTIKAERYHLVVAFTNTTDQNIRLSLDGNVEDVEGAYVQDIFTDEIEIWAGNTVAISLKLLEKIPSGNIKWNNHKSTNRYTDNLCSGFYILYSILYLSEHIIPSFISPHAWDFQGNPCTQA